MTNTPATEAFGAHRETCAQCHEEFSVNKMCAQGREPFDAYYDEQMELEEKQ